MRRRFGAGKTVAGVNTANTAYFNLDNTGTGRLFVVQIVFGISVAPTTAPVPALVRTTARGTQASTLAGLPLDPGDTQTVLGTLDACGTGANQPTFTNTSIIDLGGLAVTAGGVWVWTFYDDPLVIPTGAGNGLAVMNVNASGASTGTFTCGARWEE